MSTKGMLSRQLLALVIGYTLLLSVPVGLVNLWISHRQESVHQQQQVRAVMSLFGAQLRKAVWDFDESAVRQILAGLSHFPALQSVEVIAPDLHATYTKAGTSAAQSGPVQMFPLLSPAGEMAIGQLRLKLDASALQHQVWMRVSMFILVLGVELLVLVVLIFSLMERSVTLPVLALSRHVQHMTPERLDEIAPEPATRAFNELHALARGVTRLQAALRGQLAERDAIARTLQESEARLRLITNSIPNQLWTAGSDGSIDYVSQRALNYFGVDADRLMGDGWHTFLHPDDLLEAVAYWAQCVRTGAECHMDVRLRRADGVYRWHAVLAVVQRDDAGAILKWFGSSTDISERKRSEAELLQSHKMNAIGQLAGGIAHDFNNQLTAILGNAELLRRQLHDPDVKRMTDGILLAANRCRDLTKNLLAFSRKQQLEKVVVDVHGLIGEVVQLLEHSLDKRIQVEHALWASNAVVRGDPTQLQNALLNLTLNARDAMPAGGVMELSTDQVDLRGGDLSDLPAGTYLVVTVRDTGTGMSDEVKRHLFEPFFTTKPAGQGTGMGLPSIQGTIESHGGAIAIESELGRGTTCRLYLPIADAQAARSEARTAVEQTCVGPLRILIVDDDAGVRALLDRSLRARGHRVTTAASGEEALQLYANAWRELDLVILDVMMPGLGGLETFRGLQRIQPRVKVLVCSGFGAQGSIDNVLQAGAQGLLQKPFEQRQLDAAIAAVISNER